MVKEDKVCPEALAIIKRKYPIKLEKNITEAGLGLDALTTSVVVGGEGGIMCQIVQGELDESMAAAIVESEANGNPFARMATHLLNTAAAPPNTGLSTREKYAPRAAFRPLPPLTKRALDKWL